MTGAPLPGKPGGMLIYKIFRAPEWAQLRAAGETAGSPDDIADGFIHFSTADTLAETARRHFGGEDGLVLAACDAGSMGPDLRWETSRGGVQFPHLYRVMRLDDVLWSDPLPLGAGGHVLPARVA